MKTFFFAFAVLVGFALTGALPTSRSSDGETAKIKLDFIRTLTKACASQGPNSRRVVVTEVNRYFKCMEEYDDDDSPLVIPTSFEQTLTLFKIKRNYLKEQCPTYNQRQPCAERFHKLTIACNLAAFDSLTDEVFFTTAINKYYAYFGYKVCDDGGINFSAFMEETDRSCTQPNIAGLFHNYIDCVLSGTPQKNITIEESFVCLGKKYRETCTGNKAAQLFWKFLLKSPRNNGVATNANNTEANSDSDNYN